MDFDQVVENLVTLLGLSKNPILHSLSELMAF